MNVNGSRFQLLLGAADWGRCRVLADDVPGEQLSVLWARGGAQAMVSPAGHDAPPLTWDAQRDELRLQGLPIVLPDTAGRDAADAGRAARRRRRSLRQCLLDRW